MIHFLQYPFVLRALVVGILVSLCAALLGVSLVLKRYSMIGDGLSHVGFGALALSLALGWAPMLVAVPIVVGAAFLLLHLSENSEMKGDAAIGLISSSALAFGVVVISMNSGMNGDVNGYLFGSILAMNNSDVVLAVGLSVLVLIVFVLFYHRIFAVTFDETFAKATGTKVERYRMLIAVLTALTIVVGMRVMGAMLISSLVIFPALTAMRVCRSFLSVVITAAIISVFCLVGGLIGSFYFDTPAGASVVLVHLTAFLLFTIVGKLHLNRT